MSTTPAPEVWLPHATLTPLLGLLDGVALVEHAVLAEPDPASGHCADDAGRALALACSMPDDPAAELVARRCLAFLAEVHLGDGRFLLRDVSRDGASLTSDDASGRALHGIGVATGAAPWPAVRRVARQLFREGVGFESPHLRARAHAALGAVAVIAGGHPPRGTVALLDRCLAGLDDELSPDWPWPESRLTYSNALLVEARLAAAGLAHDERALRRALATLKWLAAAELRPGHLSPTPVGGWSRGEPRPGFDQQAIEAWALADAAATAFELTHGRGWAAVVAAAAGWFAGANDVGAVMFDPASGRAYDGLHPQSVNRNQGCESTLALIGTLRAYGAVCSRPRRAATVRPTPRSASR